MTRTPLITYRRSVVTPDTVEALRQLEQAAANQGGVRLVYEGRPIKMDWDSVRKTPGPTGQPPEISLFPSGREVHLRLAGIEQDLTRWEEIAILWGLAVPLGFVPWTRYPAPGHGDTVFHYMGPWQRLYDHLCGEGRGELALPSVACAAQVDAGVWEGDRQMERFVQAQLHRLGAHCGPVDGIIGERTLTALRTTGLQGATLEQAADALAARDEVQYDEKQREFSYVVAPGHNIQVHSFGKVASMRTPSGASIAVDGPGRVVIDFP